MLAKRIIPCLDVKDGQTVKGTNFVNLRQAGDPVALGRAYSEQGADELVFLDITASHEGRKTFTDMVQRVAAEVSIPFMKQALWMTAGYQVGYTNLWYEGLWREQNLLNDLYMQLDFQKGPWIISVGDRFRHNIFWDKHYDKGDGSLWSYNRNDHALHASVGYHKGRHLVQGTFSRTFHNPLARDFHDYLDDEPINHNTSYKTNLAWRTEAHYTYQTEKLVATGRVSHQWLTDSPAPDESLTGVSAIVTWLQGPLRLTAGANVYHLHISDDEAVNNTFFTLKLAPTLLLGKGFRLSSVLLA